MATKTNKLLLISITVLILLISSSLSFLLDTPINDVDPCEVACQKTYPSDTHKSVFRESCSLGCGLYSIIERGEQEEANDTLRSCYDNCKNAYPSETEETTSCVLGCRSQNLFTENRHQQMKDPRIPHMDMSHALYPLLFMHNMYSSMVDTMTNQMCVSWSIFMRDGQGHMTVIRLQPLVQDIDVQDFDDYTAYRGTSSVLETNIEASGNTATEVQRHSQLKSARSVGDRVNVAETDPWKQQLEETNGSDWLTCISRKTGVPRLLLCVFILFSAVAMIWLCLSAAAPDHKQAQKLSIYGDLEYLRFLPDKKGIAGIHPQEFVQARPLPVKIRIEQI